MNNQEISRGFKLLAEGFTVLSQAFSDKVVTGVDLATGEDKTVTTVVNTKTNEIIKEEVVEPKKEAKKVVDTPKEEETTPKSTITKEGLNALSYNEIKALAKEKGVKAVGSKASIIDNILEVLGGTVQEEVAEDTTEQVKEIEETSDVEETIEDEEVIEDEEDIEEEVEEENLEEDNLYESVVKDLEDYTDEELADILSDAGLSPKGKRQALLSKIVQAIEDGLIEWADEESEETEEVAEDEIEEVEDTTEEEEYDFVTEARKSACMELEKSIRKDFKAKKLSHKEIIKFLKNIDEEFVSGGVESDLEDYIYVQFNLVDEDGELHEMSDPYYIGETICCCGQQLSELEEDEFVCEICGESYTM